VYEFHGLAAQSALETLFPTGAKTDATSAQCVNGALATHALVFQVTSTGRGGRRLQRVVGVHPVHDCTADLLHDLFWETVANLTIHASLETVAAICDGASVNRLFIKMNTSDLKRGTPNHFIQAWCWNQVRPRRKLFFIADPAHGLKKPANNWEKSHVSDEHGNHMYMPEPFVHAILSQVVQPLADVQIAARAREAADAAEGLCAAAAPDSISGLAARTQGEEAFIYLFGRVYEHFVDAKPYMAKSKEQLERDARVIELRFLLKVLRGWHTYNATVDVGATVPAAERAKWGVSHQLFFDFQLEIEGFLGLLHDQLERHGSVCLLPRRLSQDSLESLFGCLRYACGGGNHPELLKVANGVRATEERIAAKRRVNGQRKRKQNSGREDEKPTRMASWEAQRATAKRQAANAAITEAVGPHARLRRWHLSEPPGFEASWQLHLQPGAQPAVAHPISWATMKQLQVWDQETHFGTKAFHKLTPTHFDRRGALKMNMGIVIDIFSRETARGLRMLRALHG